MPHLTENIMGRLQMQVPSASELVNSSLNFITAFAQDCLLRTWAFSAVFSALSLDTHTDAEVAQMTRRARRAVNIFIKEYDAQAKQEKAVPQDAR